MRGCAARSAREKRSRGPGAESNITVLDDPDSRNGGHLGFRAEATRRQVGQPRTRPDRQDIGSAVGKGGHLRARDGKVETLTIACPPGTTIGVVDGNGRPAAGRKGLSPDPLRGRKHRFCGHPLAVPVRRLDLLNLLRSYPGARFHLSEFGTGTRRRPRWRGKGCSRQPRTGCHLRVRDLLWRRPVVGPTEPKASLSVGLPRTDATNLSSDEMS